MIIFYKYRFDIKYNILFYLNIKYNNIDKIETQLKTFYVKRKNL